LEEEAKETQTPSSMVVVAKMMQEATISKIIIYSNHYWRTRASTQMRISKRTRVSAAGTS
jgi:hypothetical protein